FFFQAEDGIRDKLVTGVQTCALPILALRTGLLLQLPDISGQLVGRRAPRAAPFDLVGQPAQGLPLFGVAVRSSQSLTGLAFAVRSEERRVGKECRSRWGP